ncbi:hypothetical protein MMC26_000718 [Xylographa opegraphella]|nr:hypothetical protein [Xylographa opegraphella]
MWVCLSAEICLSFQGFVLALNLILIQFSVNDTRSRPCYRLINESAPTIDILVTCCGEPLDVIADTVAAAATQDYPSQQFRIFILDDGRSDQLQEAVKLWNKKSNDNNGPQIHYFSRKLRAGIKSYFKAGNLRHGIEETKSRGGSEFLASLDADMLPEPDWLRRMVPHLILDDGLAMACPPQYYYNLPDDDPLGQQTDFHIWFTIFEPLNDRLDAAMCTGTGFVVRRSALEQIGGWPFAEAAEDFMCSTTLNNAGWKVAFVGEALQHGLAPESMHAHVKQKQRWVDGGIEVHKRFGFYLPGFSEMTSQMTWGQRAVGISMALREYAPITNVLSLILLPIAIAPSRSDQASLVAEHLSSWFWLRAVFAASFLCHKLNDFLLYGHIGLRRLANLRSMDIWCAPYSATRCLRSLLPPALNPLAFESTGSALNPVNERSQTHRIPLPQRLLSPDLLLYLLYSAYTTVPLLLRLRSDLLCPTTPSLAPGPGAVLVLLRCVWQASLPLRYMLAPPTVPPREELLEADGRGGRRPRKRMGVGVEVETGSPIGWVDLLEGVVVALYCIR